MQSGGFDDLLAGSSSRKTAAENLVIVRACGSKPIVDVSLKAIDDLVSKGSGKTVGDRADEPRFIDPSASHLLL